MKSKKYFFLVNIKINKYLLVTGLISLVLYMGYIVYIYFSEIKDIAQTLQMTGFLITFGMLFFILLGFQTARKNNTILFLLKTINRGYFKVHMYSFVFLLVVILSFVSAIIFCLNTFYFIIDPNNSFYLESTLFLINNLLIPFIISGVLGYSIGLNTESRFSFVYLILIWAVFSPTNSNFFSNILNSFSFKVGFYLLKNLNLGIANIHQLYQPFYGFELFWGKKIIFLLLLIGNCMLLLAFPKFKLQSINKYLIIIVLLVYSLIPSSIGNTYDYKEFNRDYIYYQKQGKLSKFHLFDYQVDEMKIDVKNFDRFSVNLQMKIKGLKYSKIAFTLYKGFIITEVTDSIGGNLNFNQYGDYTIVELPKRQSTAELNIKYTGDGSLANPATTKYIYLPSDFGWLPTNIPAPTHIVFNDHYIANSLIPQSKINYHLTYEGIKQPNYINLKKSNYKTYTGSTTGVSLILGNLTKTKTTIHGEKMVYYPKSWFVYKKDLEEYLSKFQKYISDYNSIFKTNYSLPEKIIFLPSMAINYQYMFYYVSSSDNELIIQVDPVKFTQVISLQNLIPYQIDRAIDKHSFTSSEEFASWIIFNSFLGGTLGNHFNQNSSTYQFKRIQQLAAENYLDTKNFDAYKSLLKFNNEKLPNQILLNWKEQLNHDHHDLNEIVNLSNFYDGGYND